MKDEDVVSGQWSVVSCQRLVVVVLVLSSWYLVLGTSFFVLNTKHN